MECHTLTVCKISFWLHSSWVIVRLPISIRFSIGDVCTALVALHFGLVEHLGRVIIVYHQVDQYMKKNIKKNIVSCYNILGYIIYNSTVIMTIIYLYIYTWLIFFLIFFLLFYYFFNSMMIIGLVASLTQYKKRDVWKMWLL